MTAIQVRRGTAAQWLAANPVLRAGEPALETDTLVEKIGNGTTAYNDLPTRSALGGGLSDYLDIRTMGAVSGTDCTAAIDAARAASNRLYFPKGRWDYYGTGLNWNNLFIKGAGRGETTIRIPTPGASFIVGSTGGQRFMLTDLTIDCTGGGFGGIRLTYTGTNVYAIGGFQVERVDFYNYVGAAISHRMADAPNWAIRECVFAGRFDTSSIGVALSGDVAHCVIEQCAFGGNKIGVKLAPGAGGGGNGGTAMKIHANDFVRSTGITDHARIDVWLAPTTTTNPSSSAPLISDNKFGPEGRQSIDIAILIAGADPAEPDLALAMPDMTALPASTNLELRGLRLANNSFGASDRTRVIMSTTPRLPLLSIEGLLCAGVIPQYLVEYVGPDEVPAAIRPGEEGRVSGFLNRDPGVNGITKLSNAAVPIAWVLDDPGSTIDLARGNLGVNMGGADLGGYVNTLTTPTTTGVTPNSGTTKTNTTDWLGGSDAVELSAATAPYGHAVVAGIVPGELHWIEFDLAPGSTGSSAQSVIVAVTTSGGASDRQITVAVPPTWRRYRFPYIARTGAWTQLRLSSDDGPISPQTQVSFRVGRIKTYHAAEPQLDLDALAAAVAARLDPGGF